MNESDLHVFPKVAPKFSDINEFYTLERQPRGKGQYSTVHRAVGLAKSPVEGQEVAVKITKKQKIGIEHSVRKEMDALKAAPHPNMIQFIEIREDEMQFYSVMEFAQGEDLFERVSRGDTFSDFRASTIVRSLLLALKGLHKKSWVHRDIKPGNIMFLGNGPSAPAKLIDFGSAEQIKKEEEVTKKVGTPKYMPPEMYDKKEYKTEVDMWSLGVVAFILLTGQEPFQGQGPALAKLITQGQWQWPPGVPVSEAGRGFVKALLQVKQSKRPTAEEALKLPWVARPKDLLKLPDLRDGAQRAGILGMRRMRPKQRWKAVQWAMRSLLRLVHGAPAPGRGGGGGGGGRSNGGAPPAPLHGRRQAQGRLLCNGCDGPINNPDQGIEAMDGYWHMVCFNCAMCGDPLGEVYVEVDGYPCHRACAEEGLPIRPQRVPMQPQQEVELCPKCGKRVWSGIDWGGGVYHERCFTCHKCQLPITDGNLESVGDTPFHRRCLEHIKAQPGGHSVALMQERLDTASSRGPSSSRGRVPTESLSHAGGRERVGGTMTRPMPAAGAWAPDGRLQTSIPRQRQSLGGADVLDLRDDRARTPGRSPMGSPSAARERAESPGMHGGGGPRTPAGSGARAAAAARQSGGGNPGSRPPSPPPRSESPAPAGGFQSKFCHECGQVHPIASAKFCMSCGTKRI
eukprot:TRINITY_DN10883_c0_g1_i1.p1 TRINITY_DN10883_c0_g1~~TRINITY_DN10883_c0_g1_i1.p1  ORF type:complete len:682 (+),score=235.20 TRINITY_DN10883_c0_g1_i1:173-2218(+)